jgi:hypothetical protein
MLPPCADEHCGFVVSGQPGRESPGVEGISEVPGPLGGAKAAKPAAAREGAQASACVNRL